MEDQSHTVNLEEIDTDSKADGERRGCMVKYEKILDPQGPFTNWIFLMLCVISISMDPLFFYIPVIKVDKNCMELDKNLGVISSVFRSVIDLFYIICIRYQQRTNTSAQHLLLFGHPLHKSYIDLLAVLPLPQVIIIISKMNLSNFLEAMYVLKYFVFFQFVPRVIRIYPLFRKASTRIVAEVTWAKAVFNLYLYIISGHIFGALWYFFAIEKKIECWKKACIVMNQTRCNHQSFNCHKSSENYRFLDHCSTKSHKTAFFDFGIYHDALQSGVVDGSYLQKFMYCFRWGLQSLSCFAQNLVTSTDIWENIFTITITISSVVLFIFLLGNMQLFLQSKTTRSEDMKLKVREIEQWKTFKKLTEDLQRQIQNYHQHLWRETKGVDVENLLNKFPRHLSRKIKCDLCLDLLKKVPNFGSLPDQQLKAICERLKPVLYPTQTCIIGEGDPVDEMFFIMSGKLSSTGRDGGDINFSAPLYLDEFCGEELSTWVQSSSDQLPISTRTITTHTEVEAFALMANDLKDVFKQFTPSRYRSLKWRCWAAWIIQVAWRCYCLKKHEDVKRVKNDLAAADGSSTSSIGATPFATNEIRHRNSKSRMLMKAPAVFIRKPADPDLMDKEK
ncbi:hypothetical protein LWI29_014696 [Acer saccharum]|uniref:Cyclic nucleotide-binding domain-containing protein n=1 Tax=Acer saccharum TaxID=4024 RepID=A0AA39SQJ7_ACESA|nr:hypothetical protein LWI29_014696 [Acer saccharum]